MLWQKDTGPADWVTRFTVGEDFRWDTLLLPYDVRATRAHVWGLGEIGILSDGERDRIGEMLDVIAEEARAGELTVRPEDEDCHTVLETRLTEELGETGKKVHTGRSRNDQVLAALRLHLRDHLERIGGAVIALTEALCAHGDRYDDALMPGYTHMQRAMPSTAGLWAMGYAETLAGDLEALEEARRRVNVSPLGSAAGYGVPHIELPREAVAERLGFERVQTHATSVQLSRGKLEEHVVSALMQVTATINRMATDLVLFQTEEYGFVDLPEAYCTGSSIMPQKKNPDVSELARGTHHRLAGAQRQLQGLSANLSSGYHRDLQPTKAAVMESVHVTGDLLSAMNHLVPEVTFDRERMEAACTPELYATAEAIRRVQEGVPFRDAYREAAESVEELDRRSVEEVLESYHLPGYPGHVDTGLVRVTLNEHRTWTSQPDGPDRS